LAAALGRRHAAKEGTIGTGQHAERSVPHFQQDIYYAERQILKVLPKMAKAARHEQLRQPFIQHRERTQGQVDRVEHNEMARYGALVAWAKACGLKEAVGLLEDTLEEEKKADTLLNRIANEEINEQAAGQTGRGTRVA
jgi:ferritin-like metal-binding protein YciE